MAFVMRYRPPKIIEDDLDLFKDDWDKLFPKAWGHRHYFPEACFSIVQCVKSLKEFKKQYDYSFFKSCDLSIYTSAPDQPHTKRSVLFNIQSTGSYIAKATRRGRGNHIIINPKCKLLDKENIEGSLRIKVHTRKWVPKREAFVFYKGKNVVDAAGMIVPQGLVCPEMALTSRFLSYGQRIRWID